ncbi:MAG: carbohydrate ABC transporter permease [Oscillospiraceae bacterium]|nr:carbohydrate ABC transporter permease [Oscillospiraceae bacterium]
MKNRKLIIKKRKKYSGSLGGDIAIFIMLAFLGLFMLFPIYLSVIQSIKPVEEFFIFPPRLYATNPTTQNFTELFEAAGNMWVPFSRYLFNSIFVTVTVTVLQVIFASSAAYVLAKVKTPGVKLLTKIVEISLLFQSSVTFIMVYMVLAQLHMIDTPFAITVPFIASPMSIFFMKQFMGQIPDSMIEASHIDGAGHFRTCWQIVMPNCKPAWITLIIFAFTAAWQINGWGYIFTESLKPLPTVLEQIRLSGIARMGVGAAASVFIMIPPMVLFLFCQSNVLETMAHSGLKE